MTESSEQGQSSSEQDRQDIRVERGDGVVEVTFDRPHRHNAFTRDMYAQMRELCAELAEDRDTRVLVLRGAGGRAFAAGNEISDFLEQDAVAYEDWIRELLESLFALPQVTVAAIDGVCVGGGLAVATHCDLRIATPHSRFGYPIARTLGNALAGSIVYRCASVFGESLTREMLLASRLVDAPRAHAVGALMSVTDDLDAELERVNSAIVHQMGFAEVADRLPKGMDEAGWHAIRPNLAHVSEAAEWWRLVTGPIEPREFSADDRAYLSEAARLLEWSDDPWHALTAALKEASGRKGKPLFLPLRQALTGMDHGPDMGELLPLIGESEARARLASAAAT